MYTLQGHLAVGGEDKRGAARSLLRVHVHRLTVLEHPYMCEEERTFANLREIFSQYSTLLRQNNLG